MHPERRDFLLNEYSNLNTYVSSVWTLFYTVLAGGIGVYGFLVSQIQEHSFSHILNHSAEGDAFYAITLTLTPTILSLILGQFTFAAYFFYFRMIEISNEFKVTDTWSRWELLVKKEMGDAAWDSSHHHTSLFKRLRSAAASFPLAIVLCAGIIFTPVYLFIRFRFGGLFLFAVLVTPFNLWLTYRKLLPYGFFVDSKEKFNLLK